MLLKLPNFFGKPNNPSPKPESYTLNANSDLIYTIYTAIYQQIPNTNYSTLMATLFNNLIF